jgi:hypothetical protein
MPSDREIIEAVLSSNCNEEEEQSTLIVKLSLISMTFSVLSISQITTLM